VKSTVVFGRVVQIEIADLSDDGNNGEYLSTENKIKIDKTLKGEKFKKTLYHEELHALFDRTGIRAALGEGASVDLEETICHVVEEFTFETYNLKRK
jgi:hypothetical protein